MNGDNNMIRFTFDGIDGSVACNGLRERQADQ